MDILKEIQKVLKMRPFRNKYRNDAQAFTNKFTAGQSTKATPKLNINEDIDYYEFGYDSFLRLLTKSVETVTAKYNLKVEDLKDDILDCESIYYKACLNVGMKNEVKYRNDDINLYCCNSRSITNKKKSLEEIFEAKQVDFGIIHEAPKNKGLSPI